MDVENLHLKVNDIEIKSQARFDELKAHILAIETAIDNTPLQVVQPVTHPLDNTPFVAVAPVAPSAAEEVQSPLLNETQKEIQMDAPYVKNVFEPAAGGMGGAIGGGLGAGLLGGVLGGALLGGRGLLGGTGNVEGVVTPTLLSANTAQILDAATATTAANAFREIQAAIERTAASTQLAQEVSNSALGVLVAKGQGEINTQTALTSAATQVLVQKTAGDTQTQLALGDARTQTVISEVGTANALAFKDVALGQLNSQYVLAQAIKADGDQTRALIQNFEQAELNRKIVTQANEIIELKGDRNSRGHAKETELNITQVVNQNQAQQQQQQQFVVLSNLNAALQALVQQNQTIHQGIVNLGTMSGSSGQQTAANTRVQ